MPVGLFDKEHADADHHQHDDQFDRDHQRVEGSTLFDTFHQNHGENESDQHRRQIEIRSGGDKSGVRASCSDADTVVDRRRMEDERDLRGYPRKALVKYGNEFLKVRRPAVRDRGGPDRVFENQVPANDPGEEFTEGRVRVRISRTRDRYHRSKLCVTERGEHASESRHHKRKHQRGAGAIVRGYTR